jgi:hypothetical protein
MDQGKQPGGKEAAAELPPTGFIHEGLGICGSRAHYTSKFTKQKTEAKSILEAP